MMTTNTSNMDLNFDKLYKISVFVMTMNLSHPDIPRDKKWLLKFLIIHGIYTMIVVLMLYSIYIFHDIKIGNIAQICGNGTLVIFYGVVSFKYCLMLWHQQRLKRLIMTMKSDYEVAAQLTADERRVVVEYAARGKWLIKPWLLIIFCVAGLYPVRSISLMVYCTIVDKFAYVPMFDLTYPPVLEKLNPVVTFILMDIIMNSGYLVYSVCMYATLVPLGPIFMLHACGQLELVKIRVLNLFPEHGYNHKKSKKELRMIAIQLDSVYRFVEDMKNAFQINYEMTLKGTTIAVPLISYQIIKTWSFEFIITLLGVMVFCFFPCYYSDILLRMSESVQMAIYTCGWEKQCDLRARSSLLVLLTRTARPVALRSLFDTLCLDTLTNVFKQSYRIFNLLNAVW